MKTEQEMESERRLEKTRESERAKRIISKMRQGKDFDQSKMEVEEENQDLAPILNTRVGWQTPVAEVICRSGKALSTGAFRVHVCLKFFARRKDERKCWPGKKVLEGMTGFCKNQVGIYLRELKDVGLIRVERKQRLIGFGVWNQYWLDDENDWWRRRGHRLQLDREKKTKAQIGFRKRPGLG